MRVYNDVTELIGKTALVALKGFGENLYGKCEFLNPSHSIKDRAGYAMIKDALDSGKINKDTTLIECTSGNMGISLAMVAATLGLKIIFTMPESMSIERRKIMLLYGARLELTPASEGMKGAYDRALALQKEIANSFIPSQFENLANKNTHRENTAIEILDDLDGKIDIFVAGFGTSGTISGVGEVLKERLGSKVKIVAVEPAASPLLSEGKAGGHKIQGIGANFIPKLLNKTVIDEIRTVSNEDAISTARQLALKNGLMVGISSGANVFVSSLIAKENPGKIIVTMLNDTAERYLSTDLFAGI
ncbi:cysteine synthase A [Campylobacter troglodytis]|uniref:cysteine synthase A n=1 Tax=Campylobacter troglodytis TaxID=654363 RepID=UPI00115B7A93|nr:cysteine synthase A [Campylobacter troglodytis]TQR52300.1 cysteine synthase A [Campylobacter troglodytis]